MVVVDEGVAVGGALGRRDVGRLAREGYRAVIDLRTPGEPVPAGVLGLAEEGTAVEAAGMRHESVPVDLAGVDEDLISRVGQRIRGAARPVLVHCASGRRAGAMALAYLAVERGMTAEECLSRAASLGFDCEPATKRLVVGYLEHNSPAYRDGGGRG